MACSTNTSRPCCSSPARGRPYCTFCFRWPQFIGLSDVKFASREIEKLVAYVRQHDEITDILFTGGDPMIMSAKNLAGYIEPLLQAGLPNLINIRIGTKALAYWPHKFVDDDDAEELLALFRKVIKTGRQLALMAHFNHPRELENEVAQQAIRNLKQAGVVIRTQSPVMRHINDDPAIWARMWQLQVRLGCLPYYMFLARDTGAQHYLGAAGQGLVDLPRGLPAGGRPEPHRARPEHVGQPGQDPGAGRGRCGRQESHHHALPAGTQP